MQREVELRRMAREAVRASRIPRQRPDRMWGGPGGGQPCVICAAVINRDEMAFELEFGADDAGGRLLNLHIHVRCLAAWELERDVPESRDEPELQLADTGEPTRQLNDAGKSGVADICRGRHDAWP